MTNGLLAAVAAATGAAVMVLELMGVRLMAPWFGQSQVVWTNVIGVVLAALALGQWLGGRWAETRHGPRPATLLLFAGGVSFGLPDLVSWLGSRLLPQDLSLVEAYPFVSLGSLLVALLVVGLPMVALGAVTPWLVRLSRDASRVPGRVTGRLLAAGTLGSLAGTFGATHLLLGWLGSAVAVRVGGGLLVLAGGLVLLVERRGVAAAMIGLVLPQLLLLLPPSPPPAQGRVVAEVETPYQWARVVEQDDGSRLLRLNEGLDSFHSVYRPGELWTGTYFDAFLYPALLSPRDESGRRSVLVVGLAGGTMARQLLHLDPEARVLGIEIDPDVVALGRRWFDLPAQVETATMDGRVALRSVQGDFGAILIDAYVQQIYLPPHLCTREFFTLVRQRLKEGGVAALNIGARSVEDPVFAGVAGTFASVFPGATVARVPGTRNLIVLGWRDGAPPTQWAESALAEVGARDALGWLVDLGGGSPVICDSPRVLIDGDSPVEHLAHSSWAGDLVGEDPGSHMPAGTADEALAAARARIRETRWSAAERSLADLERLGHAGQAELLRGNVAWERDAFAESRRHYERVLEVPGEDEEVRGAARSNLEALQPLEARSLWIGSQVVGLRLLVVTCLAGALTLVVAAARWSRDTRGRAVSVHHPAP